jgi:glycosyltransferase involved in cell wall biosynthesis
LRELPKKVWERVSGIELRRIRFDLTNTQSELTNTQSQLYSSRNALKELSLEVMKLVETVDTNGAKNSVSVTVIVTTKNRLNLLLRALMSISRQSLLPKEILIINNGKKFTTEEEASVRNASGLIAGLRLLDAQHLLDVSSCRELGLQKVSTKYVTYLDDDNIMWPSWIKNAFEFMSDRNVSFIYGAQLREDLDSPYFFQEFSKEQIREHNFIDTNSIMHESNFGRWTPGVTRLSDWSFTLNYLSDHPESGITSLSSISTLYKVDGHDRVTTSLYSPYRLLIQLLHGLIPESKQIIEKKSRYCVVCCTSSSFSAGPNGRANAICMECGSIEKYRAFKIINEVIHDYLVKKEVRGKIIEVDPSNVSRLIFAPFGENYLNFETDPSADGIQCDFFSDICEISLVDKSVSEFVALGFLGQIPNYQVAMKEICRVLAPNAIGILHLPPAEDIQRSSGEVIIDDKIRNKRHSQSDQLALYGNDVLERLEANGMIGRLLSVEEMLPKFLVEILGLDSGFKFVIFTPNFDSSATANLVKLNEALTGDFLKLDVFCRLLEVLDSY